MKRKMIAAILAILLLLPLAIGSAPAQAAETDLAGTIDEQIRAYADSIDQNDAVSAAAMAMALHGISGDGKTMYADEDKCLSAVLMNSELLQANLSEACSTIIDHMISYGSEQLYAC